MGRSKLESQAEITKGTFIGILISAFSFAALEMLIQYESGILSLPFPFDFLVLVMVFVVASIAGMLLALALIKVYKHSRKWA